MTEEAEELRRWGNMMTWLESKGYKSNHLSLIVRVRDGAGRGLFVNGDQSATSPLRIPQAALLNSKTLKRIYPNIPQEFCTSEANVAGPLLNGTQFLSIHLAMYRPVGDSDSEDPDFGPYISTLPRSFEGHPLHWTHRKKLGIASLAELEILSLMPPSVLADLEAIYKRYESDWNNAKQCLEKYRENLPSDRQVVNEENFLWGWLTVNTRCLYYKISPRALPQSDLTMCPLIDLANHNALGDSDVLFMKPRKHEPKPGKLLPTDFVFLPPARSPSRDEEVFLRYGEHCNRLLFVEYGFTDEHAGKEVNVLDIVKQLITQKRHRSIYLDILENEGYLSDLSIYETPTSVQASWRLICALRLINIDLPDCEDNDILDRVVQPWREVITGFKEEISTENETAVESNLMQISNILSARSLEKIRELDKCRARYRNGEWYDWALAAVTRLWEEERTVARGLSTSLANRCVLNL